MKEVGMGLIIERIPHKTVSYAFLEVQASSANEFESLRAEALKRAPHYGFAANAPTDPQVVEVAEQEQAVDPGTGQDAAPAASPATSAPTEGLSPREKARLRAQAKKGA